MARWSAERNHIKVTDRRQWDWLKYIPLGSNEIELVLYRFVGTRTAMRTKRQKRWNGE